MQPAHTQLQLRLLLQTCLGSYAGVICDIQILNGIAN